MPIGMRVKRNIKSPQSERVLNACIVAITYVKRQSLQRGEIRHHAQRAQKRGVHWSAWLLRKEDLVKRHFSPHPPGGDHTDQLRFCRAAH